MENNTRKETYFKYRNSGWDSITITVKNGYPEECLCGLYRRKDKTTEIQNCVHYTQQTLF